MIHNDKLTWREFFLLFSSPFRIPLHSRREDVEAQKVHRKVHRKLRTEQLMRSSVLLFGISFPNQHRAAGVSVLHVLFFSSVVCVFGVVVRVLLWRLTQRSCRKRKIGVSLLFRVFGRVIRGEYK